MPRSCAASFCQTNWANVRKRGIDVIFHQFPSDSILRQKWIQYCKRERNWKPTQNSALCSLHFKEEDYQLAKSSLSRSNINFKRLNLTAIPSLSQKDEVEDDLNTEFVALDSDILKYRTEVCRTCLKHCKEDSLISVDAEVQGITVLEMLIQVTAFESENNDAFPKVMCIECKLKLELAFNIRQEFIAQSELLVQLVAEDKIVSYCSSVVGFIQNNQHRKTSSVCSEESRLDNVFEISEQLPLDVSLVEGDAHSLQNQSHDVPDLNDHSCYTKAITEYEDSSNDASEAIDAGKSTIEVEVSRDKHIAPKDRSSRRGNRREVTNLIQEGNDDWESFERAREQEKASKRRQKNEFRCARKSQRSGASRIKEKILEEEVRKRFPYTTCYVCDKENDTIMDLDYHMRKHIPLLPYQCKECLEPHSENIAGENDEGHTTDSLVKDQPITLKTINQLHFHFRMHRMPHKCDKCYRRFSTTMKLKTHQWASHRYGENGLTCEYCGKGYSHKIAFRKHLDAHKKEISGEYKCAICGRAFGVKSSLQRHEASHKGERKYKCIYCDKSFSTSYNRLTHQRTHTGERPFKCETCDRAFSIRSKLVAHQQVCSERNSNIHEVSKILGPRLLPSVDGRCPYPGCNYMSTRSSTMYVHKRAKHMPLYQCDVCKKSFAFKKKLIDHMMLHTGEKPHKCDSCGRSFRRKEMHRKHMLTHDSDSNFSCTICRKSFKLMRYLQAHMLTHSVDRRFSCKFCGSSYKTRGELKKHTQRKHTEEIVEIIIKTDRSIEEEFLSVTEEKDDNAM